MRIKVDGNCDAAQVVAGYLTSQGYLVTEHSPDYILHLEEGETPKLDGHPAIVVDGIDCELESRMIYHISRLTETRIILARAGGIQSDKEIRLVFPAGETLAIEKGVFRGLLDATGPKAKTLPMVGPPAPTGLRRAGGQPSGARRAQEGQPSAAATEPPPISEAVVRAVTREGWSDFSTEVAGRLESALNAFLAAFSADWRKQAEAQAAATLTCLAEIRNQLALVLAEDQRGYSALQIWGTEVQRLLGGVLKSVSSVEVRVHTAWWRRIFQWKF